MIISNTPHVFFFFTNYSTVVFLNVTRWVLYWNTNVIDVLDIAHFVDVFSPNDPHVCCVLANELHGYVPTAPGRTCNTLGQKECDTYLSHQFANLPSIVEHFAHTFFNPV